MNLKEAETLLNYIRTSGLSVEDVIKALQQYQQKQAQEQRKQITLPFMQQKYLR